MKSDRRCWKCDKVKRYPADFYKNQWCCKPCHALQSREYRRTLRGFLDQKYTAMSRRVRGKDKNCLNTATGLSIVTRKEFIDWSLDQPCLTSMFEKYKSTNFNFYWCPTIDRINPKEGYVFGNMQFLYQHINAEKHTEDWTKDLEAKE